MTVHVGSTEQPPRRRRGVRPLLPTPRCQLVVLASDVDDVVLSAGGWLTDRALAGWDVEVLVAAAGCGGADARALQILGATIHELDAALESDPGPRPVSAVAVAADLFTSDSRVRDRVLHAYDRDIAEVTVWGAETPTELSARFLGVEHVLSTAAQSFKQHALAALASSNRVCATEGFLAGARRGIGNDLTPIGEAFAAEDTLRDRAGGR